MSKPAVTLRFALVALCLASCTSDTKSASAPPPPPPPLPTAPVPAPVPVPEELPSEPAAEEAKDDESDESEKSKSPSAKHDEQVDKDIAAEEKTKGDSLYDLAKQGKATLPDTKPEKPDAKTEKPADGVKPGAKPTEPTKPGTVVKPEPTKPEPEKPAGKVTIPSTKNVRIEVPKGMQELLNKDTRMEPWAKQVVDIADKCYAAERKTNALAEGTIPVIVTMHKDERPDADPKFPPQLSGVVACATGKLMRVKMPLFTGPEGQKHSVKIVFTK